MEWCLHCQRYSWIDKRSQLRAKSGVEFGRKVIPGDDEAERNKRGKKREEALKKCGWWETLIFDGVAHA